jgi:hypothetical protein
MRIAALCFVAFIAFLACAKPVYKKEGIKSGWSEKSSYEALSAENKRKYAAESETFSVDESFDADSLLRFDEEGNIREKIYGARTRKKEEGRKDKEDEEEIDKARDARGRHESGSQTEIKTDEENGKGALGYLEAVMKLALALAIAAIVAIVFWRKRK